MIPLTPLYARPVNPDPQVVLVTRFGAKCDATTDDSQAFQRAFDAVAARCKHAGAYVVEGFSVISVPNGAACKIDRPLFDRKSDCVGLSSESGATLDFTRLGSGQTALSLLTSAYGAYSGNIARFEHIQMIGPGPGTKTVGIASATPNITLRQYNIHGFGHGYEVHSGSWLNHFVNVMISDCAIDLYCGSGLKDAGEQISFEAGSLFNSGQALENDSCEFNITDSSMDEFSGPAVINGGGSTRLTSDHIEYVNSTARAPLMVSSKACNAWGG